MAPNTLPTKLRVAETAALLDFTAWLRARFGMRIQDLRLSGSRARGQGHEDSDLDVLAVIDDLTAAERQAVWEYSGDILTNHEVILGGMTLSTQRWRELQDGKRRIVDEIERDGVPL